MSENGSGRPSLGKFSSLIVVLNAPQQSFRLPSLTNAGFNDCNDCCITLSGRDLIYMSLLIVILFYIVVLLSEVDMIVDLE